MTLIKDSPFTSHALQFLAALIMLSLAGCNNASVSAAKPSPNAYLALGDSYTIGESVKEVERWPVQLVQALRKKNVTIDDPTILARTGWTTTALQQALDDARLVGPYRLVSLLIGVNDQYTKSTPEAYRPRFAKLLQRAIKLAGDQADRVLVLSIPDYNYGPDRKFAPSNISESIDQFNMVCKEETQKQGAVYIDVTTLSRQAVDKPELRAGDNLHFSGEMYALWVNAMLPKVIEMLK